MRGVSTARVRHALEPLRPEPRDGHAEAVKRRLAGGMLAEPSQRRGVAMRDRLLVRGVSSARVRRAPGLQRPETRLGHAAAGVQAEHDGVRRNGFGQCWSGHAPLGTLSTTHSPSTLRAVTNSFWGGLVELRIQSGRKSKDLESLQRQKVRHADLHFEQVFSTVHFF